MGKSNNEVSISMNTNGILKALSFYESDGKGKYPAKNEMPNVVQSLGISSQVMEIMEGIPTLKKNSRTPYFILLAIEIIAAIAYVAYFMGAIPAEIHNFVTYPLFMVLLLILCVAKYLMDKSLQKNIKSMISNVNRSVAFTGICFNWVEDYNEFYQKNIYCCDDKVPAIAGFDVIMYVRIREEFCHSQGISFYAPKPADFGQVPKGTSFISYF
jgi:hypothetical protein